ncbi:MAG TPA: mannose-1-phosphate guanylyltransferase/mannose-6-phosphate isomerase [Xanthobacteraceae bacterium]|nr:mannose-1-phosphate guanylyltransferase/mannose-6-phosphate isomerase [Xanthobacteraceae bacterium]
MAQARITPLILAGGSGTRLWPVSRDAMPKQFMPLVGQKSTFQQALQRLGDTTLFAAPIVMTVGEFRFFVQHQAAEVGCAVTVVLEPERRDSGPAVAAGALIALQRDPDAVVLALAADHVILDTAAFHEACRRARDAADAGRIVTFGISPSEPKTGYGYIQPGGPLEAEGVRTVQRFVEKPDAATAARYVADGYLWNSGNFMFRSDVLKAELSRHAPDLLAAVSTAVAGTSGDMLGFTLLGAEAYGRSPRTSFDYAVMEKTDRAAVVEARFGWSDIGSWEAIYDIAQRDAANNALRGPVVAVAAENCLVHAEGRLTTVLGVKDLVIVSTPDAVMVAPRGRAEEVKHLVTTLKQAGHVEATSHRRVHRPWGYYESVDAGDRFQVKRLVVAPKGKLSLQRHLHRAEHWVVVRGTAEVTIGDKVSTVHENESVYVPIGAVHRLANPGKIALELVEVQSGSYLGEDDIERFDDVYRRDQL